MERYYYGNFHTLTANNFTSPYEVWVGNVVGEALKNNMSFINLGDFLSYVGKQILQDTSKLTIKNISNSPEHIRCQYPFEIGLVNLQKDGPEKETVGYVIIFKE